ncbi:hypothetical protein ElyMa_000072600 [Elysia marginata]|uniref:C2H2-type domain-containing protein n=1 Tax=Elysia marginata TaxID=1093978 RepID=A0AAV4EHS8_9GAST|nr:hypothetical protein ElyMa_000072600 [Elysia marginata]
MSYVASAPEQGTQICLPNAHASDSSDGFDGFDVSPAKTEPAKRRNRGIQPQPVVAWERNLFGLTGRLINLSTGSNRCQTIDIPLNYEAPTDANARREVSKLDSGKQFVLLSEITECAKDTHRKTPGDLSISNANKTTLGIEHSFKYPVRKPISFTPRRRKDRIVKPKSKSNSSFPYTGKRDVTDLNKPCSNGVQGLASHPGLCYPPTNAMFKISSWGNTSRTRRRLQHKTRTDRNASLRANMPDGLNHSSLGKAQQNRPIRFPFQCSMRLPVKIPLSSKESDKYLKTQQAKPETSPSPKSKTVSFSTPQASSSICCSNEGLTVTPSAVNVSDAKHSNLRNLLLCDIICDKPCPPRQSIAPFDQKRPVGGDFIGDTKREISQYSKDEFPTAAAVSTPPLPTSSSPCFSTVSNTIVNPPLINTFSFHSKQKPMTIYTYAQDPPYDPTTEEDCASQTPNSMDGYSDAESDLQNPNKSNSGLLKGHALGCPVQCFNVQLYKSCETSQSSTPGENTSPSPQSLACECTPCDGCQVTFKSKFRVFSHKLRSGCGLHNAKFKQLGLGGYDPNVFH